MLCRAGAGETVLLQDGDYPIVPRTERIAECSRLLIKDIGERGLALGDFIRELRLREVGQKLVVHGVTANLEPSISQIAELCGCYELWPAEAARFAELGAETLQQRVSVFPAIRPQTSAEPLAEVCLVKSLIAGKGRDLITQGRDTRVRVHGVEDLVGGVEPRRLLARNRLSDDEEGRLEAELPQDRQGVLKSVEETVIEGYDAGIGWQLFVAAMPLNHVVECDGWMMLGLTYTL